MKQKILEILKSKLLGTGALLAGAAVVSKLFGLWRDRIFLEFFQADGSSDLIFAAFKIPDFFYFLLISGTVSSLMIPRIHQAKNETDKKIFLNSFLFTLSSIFGIFCLFGFLFPQILTPIFAGGFAPEQQLIISNLARYFFGSVFLLSFSSILVSFHQANEKFLSTALAPIIYMAAIAIGTKLLVADFGIFAVGISAVIGAALHLIFSIIYTDKKNWQKITWKKPVYLWKNMWSDFGYRLANGAAFQINQLVDVLIASFLIAGTLTAFSIGTALGHILLSVVGFSVASIFFPKLSKTFQNPSKQKQILHKGVFIILGLTIPFAIITGLLAEPIIQLLYNPTAEILAMTKTVFIWTVISLPMACLNPILSKTFFANNQNKIPTFTTLTALIIATGTAAFLALNVFEHQAAITGLAIGNFLANTLNASFLGFFLWKYYRSTKTEK